MIDWDAEWNAGRQLIARTTTAAEWDARAPEFARNTADNGYAEAITKILDPAPTWTLLDVGCGAGALALPLAQCMAHVTALDFSPMMLALLQQRCTDEHVGNVATVLGSWDDDWDRLGIGTHDVVVASRSLVANDLRAALVKLNAKARRLVCICAVVGDGPRDRRIFEAVGRPLARGPDYIAILGMLHELGIYAEVTVIAREEWKLFDSHQDALAKLTWMLPQPSADEVQRLRLYLDNVLVAHAGKWRLPAPRTVSWAVITWAKGANALSQTWRDINAPRTTLEDRNEHPCD